MSVKPGSALGFEPPETVLFPSAVEAVRWARTIPDFGSFEELYALFLGERRTLDRAVLLPPEVSFADLGDWPDLVLGYAPRRPVSEMMLLVVRPGAGAEPTVADAETWDIMRLAHDARGVPLADIVLVDGPEWHSLAETLG